MKGFITASNNICIIIQSFAVVLTDDCERIKDVYPKGWASKFQAEEVWVDPPHLVRVKEFLSHHKWEVKAHKGHVSMSREYPGGNWRYRQERKFCPERGRYCQLKVKVW